MPAGDWARAGRVSSQRFNNAMTAVAINSVDPNKLIQESMKARSQEKQTAMKAEAALRGTEDDVRTYKAKVKSRMDIQEAEMGLAKTKRKAGMIAAAGSLIAGGLVPTPDPIKPYTRDTSGIEQLLSTQGSEIEKLRGDAAKLQEEGAGTITTFDRYTQKDLEPGGRLYEGGQSTISPTMGPQAKLDQTTVTASTLTTGMTPLLETIAFAEGTTGERGFTTRFGGGQFNLGKDHPRIGAKTHWGTTSAAAGKFQIMPKTWDTVVQPNLNLPDFSRESQIEAGRFLTKRRGVDPDARITNIDDFRVAMDRLAPEWAGLPYSKRSPGGYGMGSSYHGQGGKDLNTLFKYYNQFY